MKKQNCKSDTDVFREVCDVYITDHTAGGRVITVKYKYSEISLSPVPLYAALLLLLILSVSLTAGSTPGHFPSHLTGKIMRINVLQIYPFAFNGWSDDNFDVYKFSNVLLGSDTGRENRL